jgi:hypothetical protein
VVVKYSDRGSTMVRVRRQLRTQPPEQRPTFDRPAHDVHMWSSLRRRLMEEGGSYQQLKVLAVFRHCGRSVVPLGAVTDVGVHGAGVGPGASRQRQKS